MGPKIITLKYRKLSSDGEALMPGAARSTTVSTGRQLLVRLCIGTFHNRTRLRQQPLRLLWTKGDKASVNKHGSHAAMQDVFAVQHLDDASR